MRSDLKNSCSRMSLIFDEYGRPFILLRDQESKKRTKGLEAHKVGAPPNPVQYHGLRFARQDPQDLPRTPRHGQDARQVAERNKPVPTTM